jgi:hypothetical protein
MPSTNACPLCKHQHLKFHRNENYFIDMPSFNFQKQFVPAISDGTKSGTIRQTQRCKPGDTMFLFTGLRTKKCNRLRTVPCVAVLKVTVPDMFKKGTTATISLNDQRLSLFTEADFVKADGFPNSYSFYEFFQKQYGLPFTGYWHVWDKNVLERLGLTNNQQLPTLPK